MRILPTEAVNTTALSSLRPPAAVQLTPDAHEAASSGGLSESVRTLAGASSVSLSDTVRTLVAALARTLPDSGALRVQDVLSDADRLLLTWASDFAIAHGFDPAELHHLALDLGGYRLRALAREQHRDAAGSGAGSATGASSIADEVSISKSTRAVLLALPTLSPRDESIARAIMASLALRDTRIDQDFVRALLDPDRQTARSVDLALVRRLVLALSPGHEDGALDPERTFAERDARGLLARALSTLAVSSSELSSVSDERAQAGTLLLRARLSHALAARPGDDVGAELRALTQLTRNDRALLALMYATAQSRGSGLDAVDGVAGALLALRSAERVATAEQPDEPAVHPWQRAAGTTYGEGSRPAASLPAHARSATRPDAVVDAHPLDHPWSEPTRFASPSLSQAPLDGMGMGDRPAGAGALGEAGEPPLSWWPRGYGSATQLAARLTGSYASAEAAVLPNSFVQGALAGLPTSHGYAHAPPLNIAQVLGLSALVSQVHTRSLRARRLRMWRRRDDSIRGVEALHKAADESEAQELLEGSERRRRAYHALMQRRRRARALRRASDSYALSAQS